MKAKGTSIERFDHDRYINGRTRLQPPRPPADLRSLFVTTYESFAPACRGVTEPGLAIVAVYEDLGRVASAALLKRQAASHVAVIVGRHDQCGLVLDRNDDMPLRQLAVLLEPIAREASGHAALEYRVLDLNSERGFLDEQGRALRGIRCNGAAILRCAGHALYLLPVGRPEAWPDNGIEAWDRLPARVYLDEATHLADGTSSRVPRIRDVRDDLTHITSIPGPRAASESLVRDGDVVGTLELFGPTRSMQIQVGAAALRDGVLIGRYPRCDGSFSGDDRISRVHALFLQVGDHVLVVDTASTNGTSAPGQQPAPLHAIRDTTELMLGEETRVIWRWLS